MPMTAINHVCVAAQHSEGLQQVSAHLVKHITTPLWAPCLSGFCLCMTNVASRSVHSVLCRCLESCL